MENNLEKLKILAENIQAAKLGKRGKDNHVNSRIVIDEYHEWRAESEHLFAQFFDDSNSQYKTFIDLPRDGNGFSLIGYFNQQYPIFKILMQQIESGNIMKLEEKTSRKKAEGKTVFISHATKDKEIIDAFVDVILHGALSVPIDKIFCTSTDGTKIKSGDDWRNAIKDNLISAKLNFLIITPNYKDSEVCMNEMGAAWVTSAIVLPLIIEPINYKTVGVIQEPTQVEKLLDEKSLDRIKDIVQETLEIPATLIKSDRWTTKKTEFLYRVKKYLVTNPFEVPLDRETINELIHEKTNLENTVNSLIEEKVNLQSLVNDLKKAKDKKDVEAIIKKRKPSTQFQELEELCGNVARKLSQNSSIINGIIYKSYSGKSIGIKWERNKEVLDEALANDFIDEELDVKWHDTQEMQSIYDALNNIDSFLNKNLTPEFHESYEENYEAPLDLRNKKFWEEAFDASISFS